ncbi:MAG TPA: penicillin-binding transpeptidase domain-containing protein [Candidatus Didemnitutus sp.]|nr:penicillin-binding transpeptidase domain-containing protein [Candidatus Didemnitutus sp.]
MARTIETHSARNPRLLFFHGLLVLGVLVLVGGLGFRQLLRSGVYSERERLQNQRRVISPGPRGNILDREGRILVGNRPRFSVVLYLAELRGELRSEVIKVIRNYRDLPKGDRPTPDQIEQIARVSVTQRYLDRVNAILGRDEKVRQDDLDRHFSQSLLLPYVLLDDLSPAEYARLIERLPVNSPLQVYTSSTRDYPNGSTAAHVLGYIGVHSGDTDEDIPGDGLTTFKMKGTVGRDGLEKKFDDQLQGDSGVTIYRVDPAGYEVKPPVESHPPIQGHNIVTSLDLDLQQTAEKSLGDQVGAVVAMDVHTGEVLAMTSKPDYDLSEMSPRINADTWADILSRNALRNEAIMGAFPPGSMFKLVTAIAGLRSGRLPIDKPIADCDGIMRIGNKNFYCDNGEGHHGEVLLPEAIAISCDIYFYQAGLTITPEVIAAEARRFHLDRPTGIELPNETDRMVIPDPAWKEKTQDDRWYPGDTANMSIGQGYVLVSPIDMACFACSLARNETVTHPTILHDPNAPTQHSEPIGLTDAQRAALLKGMEECTIYGTAKPITLPKMKIPGVRIAGKTGTAQKRVKKDGKVGNINYSWFLAFAPLEKPEIAVAVMIEGDVIGENFAGGMHAAPVANDVMRTYFDKQAGRDKPAKVEFKVN